MSPSHVIEMVDDILSLNQPFYQSTSSSSNNNSIKQSLPLSIQLWKW